MSRSRSSNRTSAVPVPVGFNTLAPHDPTGPDVTKPAYLPSPGAVAARSGDSCREDAARLLLELPHRVRATEMQLRADAGPASALTSRSGSLGNAMLRRLEADVAAASQSIVSLIREARRSAGDDGHAAVLDAAMDLEIALEPGTGVPSASLFLDRFAASIMSAAGTRSAYTASVAD